MKHPISIRSLAAAVLAGLALATPAAAQSERSLTLAEAIRMALQRSEGLAIARASVSAAAAGVRAASGAYDPVLALNGDWTRSTQPANASLAFDPLVPQSESAGAGTVLSQLLPTGGTLALRVDGARTTTRSGLAILSPAYDTRAGVELRQPLLRDRSVDAARLSVRVARADQGGAAAALRRTAAETVVAVEQAYWTLAAARLRVEVGEEAVRLAGEQLRLTETRVEGGTASRTDLAEPRAELERRRGELLEDAEAAARAGNALKLLILADEDPLWPAGLVPADSVVAAPESVDVEAAVRQALGSRAELREAAAVVERRRAESAFAHDGIRPALDAVVSYDRYGLAGSPNLVGLGTLPSSFEGDLGSSISSLRRGHYDATRVALVLGLPLADRTARGNAAAARAAERQAEAGQSRARKTIRAEVLDAAAALQTAEQRIAAARSGRAAAEAQLAAERDRFASGLSTNFLVLTRQNELSRARLDEISALTDYRLARAALRRATGAAIEESDTVLNPPGR